MNAAERMVARKGASRVSLRAIAREAGVSAAAPYHHFEDREALLAAVAASGFDELARRMTRAAEEHGNAAPLGRLRAIGIAYVEFAVDNPQIFRLMFSGLVADRSRSPVLLKATEAAWEVLQDQLGGEGPPASGDGRLPLAALAAWSTVHGLAFLLIEGILADEVEAQGTSEIARRVATVLGPGLARSAGIQTE